jgi:hypothetical protein
VSYSYGREPGLMLRPIGPGEYRAQGVCTFRRRADHVWQRVTCKSEARDFVVAAPPDSLSRVHQLYKLTLQTMDDNVDIRRQGIRAQARPALVKVLSDYPETQYGRAAASKLSTEMSRDIGCRFSHDTVGYLREAARLVALYPNDFLVPYSVADLWASYGTREHRKMLLEQWANVPAGTVLAAEVARHSRLPK